MVMVFNHNDFVKSLLINGQKYIDTNSLKFLLSYRLTGLLYDIVLYT